MLSIGSIIYSSSKVELLSKEMVDEIWNTFNCEELFSIAWAKLIKPWLESGYATLNLRTGRLEEHDEFSMSYGTPYLILFKVDLASLAPENILTVEEMYKYEGSGQLLEQFCEKHSINVKERAKSYYLSHWRKVSWYFESIIEDNLFEFYETREVAQCIEIGI